MSEQVMPSVAAPTPTEPADDWRLRSSTIFSASELAHLNVKSDYQGYRQLAAHLAVMAASGALWGLCRDIWPVAIPALVIYGFSLASMFAPLHECVHRTAFASRRANEGVAWLAGVLSFYNSTFYRRYHKWHHRYTRIPGKDPELEDVQPVGWRAYLWQLSGVPWWIDKVRGHWWAAVGDFDGCPYISDQAGLEVMRSTRWQLAVYGFAIIASVLSGQPWFVTYWLLPLAVGQPLLRFILLAEHTGCSLDANPLTNTRTTLTLWPVRLLMWNMPFHAEHHLYPSIPFHALPLAHDKVAMQVQHLDPGYVAVNRSIVANFQHG